MLGRTALAAAAPPAGISPPLTKFVDQLPVPPMIDLTGGGSGSLAMAPGSHRFHAQLGQAATFGYGGASYLGPTLQVRRGVPVSLTFPNRLGAHPLAGSIDPSIDGALQADKTTPRASVHVHGGLTAPRPTSTSMARRRQPSGTTTTPWGSPGSTSTPGWPATT